MALPEMARADGWRDLGLRILLEQARKQVRADGVYFEQSSLLSPLHDGLLHAPVGADVGEGLQARPRIGDDDLAEAGSDARPPDVDHAARRDLAALRRRRRRRLINLADRAANDFRDTLAVGSALFNRCDWKHVAGDAPAELLWLIGPEGVEGYDQMRAEPPSGISKAFRSGGYFVMRDGWRRNSSFVLIDCGPHGADTGCGHAHADALSIEFASRGVSWIVDPGAYVYAADPKTRDEFGSTAAHNTVTVDDQSQSVASTPFSWRTAARCRLRGFIERGDTIFFQGSHDGYERLKDPVEHTRSVLFVKSNAHAGLPEYLIVRDRFTANKRHRYAIRYHLAPDCEARPGADRVEARHSSGVALTIRVICETGVITEMTAGATAEATVERPE